MKNKPIGFANGDGGTGRGAQMVRQQIFPHFPMIEVPVTVEERIRTNDRCLSEALNAFRECGAGFKNSTASAHPEIVRLEMGSANIQMRGKANAHSILRLIEGPGCYENPCGVIRLATGGFYDEVSCITKNVDGVPTAVIVQHLDLIKLGLFAKLALDVARARGWHLVLASKSTIAHSEKLFRDSVEEVWEEAGLVMGETKGDEWTGDWHHELTDFGMASLPIKNAKGISSFAKGEFLFVAGNVDGDTSSDLMDHQHGNHVMGSRVCGMEGEKPFSYEELTGGTAEAMATGPLKGKKFLSPAGIIFALVSAIGLVNPHQQPFLDEVRKETLGYLKDVPPLERDTEQMIAQIADRTADLVTR